MDETTVTYLIAGASLILFAYLVFRKIVRRDYLRYGRLTRFSSALQLFVFLALICFPYVFAPDPWPWFWRLDQNPNTLLATLGLIFIILGLVFAFGAMFWFGLRRAFGLEVVGLQRSGPYRLSRNPQLLGGYLLFLGVAMQWPSWYALGWILLYGHISHMMILTEEDHLLALFGEEYRRYCQEVPRYLGLSSLKIKTPY